MRRVNQFFIRIQIPQNLHEARLLQEKYGHCNWEEAEQVELKQIADYKTLRDLGKGAGIPSGYMRICVHFVYNYKLYNYRAKCSGGTISVEWIRYKKNTPISRYSLELATGINRRSQQRYDLAINVTKRANYTLFHHTGKQTDTALEHIRMNQGKSMGLFRFVVSTDSTTLRGP